MAAVFVQGFEGLQTGAVPKHKRFKVGLQFSVQRYSILSFAALCTKKS